ncbi:MAG: hypothetical protein AAB974_00845 [Patescibacteria group bacterium]
MRRLLVIAVLVVLGIAVVGTASWVFFGRSWLSDRQAAAEADMLRADPQTAEMFASIEKRQREIESTPDDPELYLSIGNNWKAIYDFRGDVRFLDRAIEWYEKGVGVTKRKNSLFLLNLANAYRLRTQPDKAERLLREAIEVNPGDPVLYTTLVDVLRYDLKRDSNDVIDVYKTGLASLVDNAPLVQSLALYLEDIGRYKDALVYYELLAAKYPGFEEKIASLKQHIAEQP